MRQWWRKPQLHPVLMCEQVIAQIMHEDGDSLIDIKNIVLRVARAVPNRIHALTHTVAVDAQDFRVRDDVAGLVEHRGGQVARVRVHARGRDDHVRRDGHVVVEVAVRAAVWVLARPDLPNVVNHVHAEAFELLCRFVADAWS